MTGTSEPTITLDEVTYVEVRAAIEIAIGVLNTVGNRYDATSYEAILTKIDADWDAEVERCRSMHASSMAALAQYGREETS